MASTLEAIAALPVTWDAPSGTWEMHDAESGEISQFASQREARAARAWIIANPTKYLPMTFPGRI